MRYLMYSIIVVALGSAAWTSITQIEPGERAVVRRFGRILEHKPGPGWFVGLPWGMDRVDRVPVGRARRVSIGSSAAAAEEQGVSPAGQLVTGDHNLVNVQVEVVYAVHDDDRAIAKFVVQADRAEELVIRATESALAEWIAARPVDEVLLRGKGLLPGWLVPRVQERLQEYDLGVEIRTASVAQLGPPSEVKFSFDEVGREQTRIKTRIYEAEQEANRKVREAEATKFRLKSLAKAHAQEQRLLAQAEAAAFSKRVAQYHQARKQHPNYLTNIWWDEMSRLFARMRENGRLDLLDHHLSGDGLNITQMPLLPKKK